MIVNSNRFNFEEIVHKWIVNDYAVKMWYAVDDAIIDVAKESVKKLKASSPSRSGKYAKNWTYEPDKGRVKFGATVYGKKPTYRLAHLLEYGHPVKRGGRTVGQANAIPHIAEVDRWAYEEAYDRVIQKLEKATF